jgi:Xaa-Pro aminopeptidase
MSFCKAASLAQIGSGTNFREGKAREMDTGHKAVDLDQEANRHALYAARLDHTRAGMRAHDIPAMLIVDPNQIAYSTGATNMTLWSARTPARYLLILLDGPVILFDFKGAQHLAVGLPTVDEIRPAEGLDYVSSGGDMAGAASRFAREIAAILRDSDSEIDRIAVDRFPFMAVDALRAEGLSVTDAHGPLALARMIKLPVELPYIREAMRRVEAGVERLESKTEPGMTETEAWAEFHYSLMAKEGQYVSTRLFQSGPNTYPYFQEAGRRSLQKGDLLCLDTDAIGYESYAVDFSRTFLCGDRKPTPEQKTLYGRAREQLEWNAGLLAPGRAYRELAEKAWDVPDEHRSSRYYCFGHGLGMAGEFPNIPHKDEGGDDYPLDGHLEPGMVICIESYVGWERSAEGVKLEDQFLILETGVERMSNYPFDERLGGGPN